MFGIRFSFFSWGKRRRRGRSAPRAAQRPATRTASPPPRAASPGPAGADPRIAALREAFTPTRPQRTFRRLAGRKRELERILEAISQNRGHVVLYGDRGRGKTSLVNLVASAARGSGYAVGRYSCANGSDFDEIMRGLARDLPRTLLATPMTDGAALDGCEAALPTSGLQPRDIAQFPGRLTGGSLLLVIDEFDRVTDGPTRTRLADSIKQVSDRGVPLSFLIVGVSDSLEELLGRHPSIQRSVVAVPLPLLSDAEAQEILARGAEDAGLDYPTDIRNRIAGLARGLPYIVQLLAFHAGERTLRRQGAAVNGADLHGAIEQAAAEMDPRIRVLYEELTQGGLDNGMKELLLIIAESPHDGFARFLVQDVNGELEMAGQPVHQARWARLLDAGAVRSCRGAGFGLHTFADPMLLHYVLLRAELEPKPHDLPRRSAGEIARAIPAR